MSIAVRHRDDPSPSLALVSGLVTQREIRPEVMAALQSRGVDEMTRRFADGHRAYVASRGGEPAAWGWVATKTAYIGELEATVTVPDAHRYLWNFVTLAAHRGKGIYPRLLDAIVSAESAEADRYWVAYAPENHASGAGIRKAGFVDVAELSFDVLGYPAVKDIVKGGARAAAEFLGLRAADDELAHCWRCAKKAAPSIALCHSGPCACDYQQPALKCANPIVS